MMASAWLRDNFEPSKSLFQCEFGPIDRSQAGMEGHHDLIIVGSGQTMCSGLQQQATNDDNISKGADFS